MVPERQKLVFLTEEYPYPPQGGGKLRDYSMLEIFRQKFDVKLLTFSGLNTSSLPPPGVQVQFVRYDQPSLLRRIWGKLRTYIINGYSLNMEHTLLEQAKQSKFLWISRLSMAKYLRSAQLMGYTVLLDEHNVESDLLIQAALKRPWDLWHLALALDCRHQEAKYCHLASTVIATSQKDANLLHRLAPSTHIAVLPNTIDSYPYRTIRNEIGTRFLFIGTLNYQPNVEGLAWFLHKIFPRLKSQMPESDLKIRVAGSHPSHRLRLELESAGIEVITNPSTVLPLLKDAAVIFIPLLSGSGTRLKIIEAMAAGRAIVSTTKGAEGIEFIKNKEIAVADTPNAFADEMVQLYNDLARRQAMGVKASHLAESLYDWRSIEKSTLEVLSNTGSFS